MVASVVSLVRLQGFYGESGEMLRDLWWYCENGKGVWRWLEYWLIAKAERFLKQVK